MERIKTLLARYRQVAFLFFMGLILIAYLGMGILYLQQAPQQRALQDQIAKTSLILKNPPPSIEPLQTAISNANLALTPIADNVTIAMLVRLAKESGIDISQESGRLQLPIPSHGSSGLYQLLSFRGVHVQGERDKVEAFISMLDSATPLKVTETSSPRTVIRVVTRVAIDEVEVPATGQEAERRNEFRSVIDAVIAMMQDNDLFGIGIPSPVTNPTNLMGDDPATPIIRDSTGNISSGFEGFPDIITIEKGYTGNATGNATPRQGYLLWEHDKISSDNTTLYSTVNYTQTFRTTYYYTAEKDGTVRQWSGTNVAIAAEYPESTPTKTELRASMDIDFYFKPVTISK